MVLELNEHARITGTALKNWLIAQTQDALLVGVIWFLGTWAIGLPWPLAWGIVGFACQYIPNIGAVFALIGPVLAALFSGGGWEKLIYVLILYAGIVVVDGLVLQPWLMKRTARVPIWASIVTPIVLGIVLPFWGVLLSAPLLAVVYAYKRHNAQAVRSDPALPPQGEILPPERTSGATGSENSAARAK